MGFRLVADILPEVVYLINEANDHRKFRPEPVYMPGKYESPIEDIFAWHITKYLDPDVNFYAQYPVKTICGKFRLDFLIDFRGRRIAFECDGKDFHEPERDLWRDAMILGTEQVDVIFRLRGRDIYMYPLDLLHFIAKCHSGIFSLRGQAQLLTLASQNAVNEPLERKATSHLVEIIDVEHQNHSFLKIDRRFRHTFDTSYQWDTYHEFAKSVGGGNLDEVISAYERKL